MGTEQHERRRHPRVAVPGRTEGKVNAVHGASILDISLGGVMIEHPQSVQPGMICDLDVTLLERKMRLRCRVARSLVQRAEKGPSGKQRLIYRTGLEFIDPSDEMRQTIADFIMSIIEAEDRDGTIEPTAHEPLEHAGLHISQEGREPDTA